MKKGRPCRAARRNVLTIRIQAAEGMGNTLRGSPRIRMTIPIVNNWNIGLLFLQGYFAFLSVSFTRRMNLTDNGEETSPSPIPIRTATGPAGAAGGARVARPARPTA